MIEFAYPWLLAALPLPWFVWRYLPARQEQLPALRVPFFRRLAAAIDAQPKAGSLVLRRNAIQMITAIAAWSLVVVALAKPELVGKPVELKKAARDIVLAIDISGSMDEKDFLTGTGARLQRLAGVKKVVGEFIEAREGDRVALIVFGNKAFVQAPFTEDLRTVRQLLEQTEVGMAGPHTVIGDAIGLAIRTFEASDIEQRLLILLSDGADTGSRMSPINAAGIAADNRVEIHTVGVGDPNGSGDQRVDQAALEAIASRTGGRFFFAGDEIGLANVYQRIDELTPRNTEVISFRQRHSMAHWPLAAAATLIIIALTWLNLQTSRRRSV